MQTDGGRNREERVKVLVERDGGRVLQRELIPSHSDATIPQPPPAR